MILIYVDTGCGKVSDHFEFGGLPHKGDVIFIQAEHEEIKLCVNLVEHYPIAKGDVMDHPSSVTLQCEVIPHTENY